MKKWARWFIVVEPIPLDVFRSVTEYTSVSRQYSFPKTYAARATALGAKFSFAFVVFFAVTALRSRHPEHSFSSHVDPFRPHKKEYVIFLLVEPPAAKPGPQKILKICSISL